MPIIQFLDGERVDPETLRIIGVAFEMILIALRRADDGGFANETIAKKVIALARTGEQNPDLLCETVLNEFRERRLSKWPA